MMMENNNFILKPSRFGKIFWRVLFSLIGALGLYVFVFVKHDFQLLFGLLFVFLIYLYVEIGNGRSYFKYENGNIEYSLFGEEFVRIRQNDIDSSWFEVGFRENRGIERLVVQPKAESGIKTFFIVFTAYDNEDILKMMQVLPMKEVKSDNFIFEYIRKHAVKKRQE